MLSFPFHLIGLLIPGLLLARSLRLSLTMFLGATFIVFEASLIFGAGILSWAHLLGNLRAYQITTIVLASALAACLWLIAQPDIRTAPDRSGPTTSILADNPYLKPPIICIAIFTALLLWLAFNGLQYRMDPRLFRRAYIGTTLLMALGLMGWFTLALSHDFRSPGNDPTRPTAQGPKGPRFLLFAGPLTCFAIFGTLMLWMALNSHPDVEDSLTIKLAKIIFSIESNSFLPSNLTDDPRMYISPVYPALLQLFLIINGQTAHALLVFGFVNWAVCGLAIYQICRYVEISKLSSWITIVLVMLSPTLIIQGSSEGDDILAAAPFLLSLFFLLTWARTDHNLDAALAGLGLGLSVGIKLFPIFYFPAIPIILLAAIYKYRVSYIVNWLRAKATGALLLLTTFILALLPQAIANWVAFGNPLYVSASVLATRNSPFSYDCAFRGSTGYLKQFLLSDMLRLIAHGVTAPISAAVERHEQYVSTVARYNAFLSKALSYDPPLACSAWGNGFIVTNWIESDNTFWFGAFGPLLLFACLATLLSRRTPFVISSLAIGLLAWAIVFSFGQKYIADISRYWSLAILAGSPIVAAALDQLIRRDRNSSTSLMVVASTGAFTIAIGILVLMQNYHRSLRQLADDAHHYDHIFPADVRSTISKATSINVQLIYEINTYDFYMMTAPNAKVLNKSEILGESVNYVLVRRYGVVDNPFSDTRIAVRMDRPFAQGFEYVGEVPMGLLFSNNIELVENSGIDPKSVFLIFQTTTSREGSSISVSLTQIASPTIMSKVRYRLGWRALHGEVVIPGDWKHGLSATLQVPADAGALVVQAAFDEAETSISTTEWPMSGFTPEVGARLNR